MSSEIWAAGGGVRSLTSTWQLMGRGRPMRRELRKAVGRCSGSICGSGASRIFVKRFAGRPSGVMIGDAEGVVHPVESGPASGERL